MNVLPLRGALTRRISPPSSRVSSRLIASPRPVPPYLRLVLPSACWNASKMICCLSGEMPMPVSRTDIAITSDARFSVSFCGSQPDAHRVHRQRHAALVGELERVGQQVLQHLLQPLQVREHRRRQPRIDAQEEVDALRFGNVAERALDVALQLVQPHVRRVHHDGAGLDLRQVEDVVDQRQQIVARRMNRLRELDLLRHQVAGRVLAQLVGQDQQAVERRAQLVRHVREELGLVLGGERELFGLFLERLARLLHFHVLALDLLVLVRKQPGLFLELLVRLLQLLLAALQLVRERLRLREQVLGAHVGFDRVDDDADRFRQLIEELLMRRAEPLERRELEHPFHLAFEDDRQHEDILRRRRAETREDPHVILRHVREQDLRLLDRALPDEAFAEIELTAQRTLPLRSVARDQRQPRHSPPCRARRTARAVPQRQVRARTG